MKSNIIINGKIVGTVTGFKMMDNYPDPTNPKAGEYHRTDIADKAIR